ncbi:Uncharacterized protein TCM_000018 [Theobroma cacao]|uniref:Uncharacterized protein n=1 Tax=Theobroma cacao TaxID=3641 RepID=A0A061DF14_THECC|nr:Uncharacterized protein TCM_000018 [Theobroma cacao]
MIEPEKPGFDADNGAGNQRLLLNPRGLVSSVFELGNYERVIFVSMSWFDMLAWLICLAGDLELITIVFLSEKFYANEFHIDETLRPKFVPGLVGCCLQDLSLEDPDKLLPQMQSA